jgi:3-isopropylmalate dehydratase small subunit
MDKPSKIAGRVLIVPKHNIDTDMIFHNAHLAITDIKQMGRHTFTSLDGFKDFPEKARPGDILVSGGNFGCGSSRQQAVDCFASLGVRLVVAESFGAIYKRNAINSAFPILTFPGILGAGVSEGDEVEFDLRTGEAFNRTKNASLGKGQPFSGVQWEIYQAGNLFEYGRRAGEEG